MSVLRPSASLERRLKHLERLKRRRRGGDAARSALLETDLLSARQAEARLQAPAARVREEMGR